MQVFGKKALESSLLVGIYEYINVLTSKCHAASQMVAAVDPFMMLHNA